MVALAKHPELTVPELRALQRELERRLTVGWRRIDEAIASGRDVSSWEEHWLQLLGEYERVCDALNAMRG